MHYTWIEVGTVWAMKTRFDPRRAEYIASTITSLRSVLFFKDDEEVM